MRIAMLTPTDGGEVAEYARRLVAGLESRGDCEVEIVPILPGRQTRESYLRQGEICNAPEIDAVHIQYRPEFWGELAPGNSAFWELRYALKKPVILTAHTIAPLEELLEMAGRRSPFFQPAKAAMAAQGRISRQRGDCALRDSAYPRGNAGRTRNFDCAGREIGLCRGSAGRRKPIAVSRPPQRLQTRHRTF